MIAVTGATGPFGRAVVESLLERGVSPAEIVATVSQDGHWIAWATSEPGEAGVVRVAHTGNMLAVRSHRVEEAGADKRLRLYWRRSAQPRYVTQVKITPPPDRPPAVATIVFCVAS